MVDHIATEFPNCFEETVTLTKAELKDPAVAEFRRHQVWYHRVYRWCKFHKIVKRKVNRVVFSNPQKVAQDIERMYTEIDEVCNAAIPEFKEIGVGKRHQ